LNNCTFEHLRSSSTNPPAIYFSSSLSTLNTTDCIFKNISGSNVNINAGVMYYNMYSSSSYLYSGYYNVTGNTFINISAEKSAIHFNRTFKTLKISNNNFRNISISSSGGVFYFINC
jgi:hypothetical protein